MDAVLSLRFVRLRLERLEDRLAPSITPVFSNVLVPDSASVNATANRTNPVVGVAADDSYIVVWQYNDPTNNDSDIYARQFNSDGTPKGAAFVVANSSANETQPAIAVAADGHFVIAYTKVVASSGGTENDVFFQIFAANGTRTLGETAAPTHSAPGAANDFSPDIAVSSSTGQFVIVWTQQSTATNSDVYARVFQPNGTALTFNDTGVATTTGNEFNGHVALVPAPSDGAGFAGAFVPVISYTLNLGSGVQKVYFRRYTSGLTPLDTGAVGIPVSGGATSASEDNSSLALDVNDNLLVAWMATPSSGPSQVVFQQFTSQGIAILATPAYVANNAAAKQTAPSVALDSNGHFVIAYVSSATSSASAPTQVFYRDFNAALQPVGPSNLFSSDASPHDAAPHISSGGNQLFVIVADDLTGSHPDAVLRGFRFLTSEVGVVQSTANGLAQFSLDSNGNTVYDTNDSVFTFGYFSDTFVIGDWNGDGYDKVGIVRPYIASAIFALDTNGDGQFDAGDQVFIFGRPTDQFLVGDWNGKGKSEIGVVRPDGVTAIFALDTNGNGAFDASDQVFTFGLASDTFVIGDWNGSGTSKIGVVRPDGAGNLVWSLDTNGDGTFDAGDQVTTFGLATDVPVVGDWNGSGKTEIGVVRTATQAGTAQFILDTNGDGVMDAGDSTFTFGLSNDKFIIGKWKPTAQPQFAALPGPDHVAALTNAQLAATVQVAIQDWAAAGLDAQQVAALEHVQVHVAQLNDNLLGLTAGNTIDIRANADGWGWYTGSGTPPTNRMDLRSTVTHELGHILGLKDTSNFQDVMGDVLTPGTQRLPTTADVDTVFAAMGRTRTLLL